MRVSQLVLILVAYAEQVSILSRILQMHALKLRLFTSPLVNALSMLWKFKNGVDVCGL